MKKLFFFLALIMAAQFARAAQTIYVNNNTSCDVVIVLYARDDNNLGCLYYATVPITITPGSHTITWTSLASLWCCSNVPTTNPFCTGVTVDHDPGGSCTSGAINLGLGCTGYQMSGQLPVCTGCTTSTNKVSYTTNTPFNDALININP